MKLQKYIKKIEKLKKKSYNSYRDGNLIKHTIYELRIMQLKNLLYLESQV